MVGDSQVRCCDAWATLRQQIGKTSLMVKYVEGSFDEDYIQTLGAWKGSATSADACQA